MLFLVLVLLFTVLPVTELALLIWIGGRIGLLETIGLVLLTGFLGAALARHQGLATLWRIQQQLTAGRAPSDALFDGALILVAGAVLLTPGVLTDAAGFALLLPPLRSVVKRLLKRWFVQHVRTKASRFGAATRHPQRDTIIDVEIHETRIEEP